MNSAKRRMKVPHNIGERGRERRTPSDQHVIMAGQHPAFGRHMPNRFPQPTPHTIAFHGISYLSRYRKPDPNHTIVVAPPGLHGQQAAGRPQRIRRGPKIAPASEPFDDDRGRDRITH
jgi:hypothetical protein